MAKTRLGAYGGARGEYGSFTKSAAGKSTDQITRLGAYGGPRQVYGTFSGKTEAGVGGTTTRWFLRMRGRIPGTLTMNTPGMVKKKNGR